MAMGKATGVKQFFLPSKVQAAKASAQSPSCSLRAVPRQHAAWFGLLLADHFDDWVDVHVVVTTDDRQSTGSRFYQPVGSCEVNSMTDWMTFPRLSSALTTKKFANNDNCLPAFP